MSLLKILNYPDPRLYKVASKVEVFDTKIKTFVNNMVETMYHAKGIGLAATQVDFHKKIIVIDISEDKDSLVVLINPELIESSGIQNLEEGCLSVPSIYEKVERCKNIRVKALNVNGKEFEIKAEGLLAVCIQHEMDHLEGKVFVEYLSLLKKDRIKKKMIKKNKQSNA
jgi:peptide deformylase